MANARFAEDYHSHFDSKTYLQQFYEKFRRAEHEFGTVIPVMKGFHEFWSGFEAPTNTEVRYLEYGGGPSIMHLVFACPKVDHIVFAEYTESSRQAVKSWIAGDPDAHNWTPLIEIVVLELEQGRGVIDESQKSPVVQTDKEKLAVQNRANELKIKIKSVVPCDVNKIPIVQLDADDVGKPFDVVSTSFCLEACVSSEVHYKKTVAELCKLLKPNGYLFIFGFLEQTFYLVGEESFSVFPITEKMVKEAMNEAGLEIEQFVTIPLNHVTYSKERADGEAFFYTYGRKSVEK